METQNNNQSRRSFLKNSILAGTFFPLAIENFSSLLQDKTETRLKIYIFSKHLQFLNYKDMAEAAAEMGFDGVDLTLRPKGHVLPEQVERDLPNAVEAMHKVGFAPFIMTTAVEDAENTTDQQVLSTASKLGFQYYRMNWLNYLEGKTIPESIEHFQEVLKNLSELNKKMGLIGCYQNHAGDGMGASIWELWELLRKVDVERLGVEYDIRHAMVEGALSWQNGLRLIQPHIKTITLKDFKWENNNGIWSLHQTPLGEGMVDFKTYFKLLKHYKIQVPVTLHMEYPLGGAEDGAFKLTCDKQIVFNAMKKDLQKAHALWQQV